MGNNRWRNTKFQETLARFMAGRYGTDQYSRFLSTSALVSVVLAILLRKTGDGYLSGCLSWLTIVMIAWSYARCFSRKLDRRRAENTRYLALRQKVIDYYELQKACFTQRKEYAFFRCPGCRNMVRVPRHKGKIRITCRRCGYSFEKKT